jgi:hypothetical protein
VGLAAIVILTILSAYLDATEEAVRSGLPFWSIFWTILGTSGGLYLCEKLLKPYFNFRFGDAIRFSLSLLLTMGIVCPIILYALITSEPESPAQSSWKRQHSRLLVLGAEERPWDAIVQLLAHGTGDEFADSDALSLYYRRFRSRLGVTLASRGVSRADLELYFNAFRLLGPKKALKALSKYPYFEDLSRDCHWEVESLIAEICRGAVRLKRDPRLPSQENRRCRPGCDDVVCAPNSFCRDGACVLTCAEVDCAFGNTCMDGLCIGDECSHKLCPKGQVCFDGACRADPCLEVECGLESDLCFGVAALWDNEREFVGRCDFDPCDEVICPESLRCEVRNSLAQCVRGL